MVGIYTQTKCVRRLDAEYREFFDLSYTPKQVEFGCESCSGEPNGKRCHTTLDTLLEEHDNKMEVDWK